MTLPNLPVVVPSSVPPPPTTAATVVRDFVTTTTTTKCAHNSRAEVPGELWPVSTSHLQGIEMVGKGAADTLVLRLPLYQHLEQHARANRIVFVLERQSIPPGNECP